MIYGNASPQEYPLYSCQAVSRAIKMPRSTLFRWLKEDHGESVILTSQYQSTLNFLQLSEAFAIIHMRKRGISLQRIRKASKYLKSELGLDYPLINPGIRVGADVYFKEAKGILLNATRYGQVESPDLIGEYICRLEFEENEQHPNVLYPWISDGETRKTIKIDPRIRFGQPIISGTGISVSAVQDRFEAGETLRHIASSYGISQEKVKDSITYATH